MIVREMRGRFLARCPAVAEDNKGGTCTGFLPEVPLGCLRMIDQNQV
jgi:hypothetical protein